MSLMTMKRSQLETLSDELFFDIFFFISPSHLYRAFFTLNSRFNGILDDYRLRFRDNISALSLSHFRAYVANVLPRIASRLVSFTFGNFDTDEYQQVSLLLAPLHLNGYGISIGAFVNLRSLTISKMSPLDVQPVLSSLVRLSNLVNVRFSVDPNETYDEGAVIVHNAFFSSRKLHRVKMDMCARTCFSLVSRYSNVQQLSIVWCPLQELTHLLQFTPHLSMLKATLQGLDSVDRWSLTLRDSMYLPRLRSVKLVVNLIAFDPLVFFLRELHFVRSLWLLLDHITFFNASKWQTDLFEEYLPELKQLDLTIALTKPFQLLHHPILFGIGAGANPLAAPLALPQTPADMAARFSSGFWVERGWHSKFDQYDHCVRLTVSSSSFMIPPL